MAMDSSVEAVTARPAMTCAWSVARKHLRGQRVGHKAQALAHVLLHERVDARVRAHRAEMAPVAATLRASSMRVWAA